MGKWGALGPRAAPWAGMPRPFGAGLRPSFPFRGRWKAAPVPRAVPWSRILRPFGARKVGVGKWGALEPRAAPWAGMPRPFGAGLRPSFPFRGRWKAARVPRAVPWDQILRPFGAWCLDGGVPGDPGLRPGLECRAPSGLGRWGWGNGAPWNPGLRPGLEYRAPSGLVWDLLPSSQPMRGGSCSQDGALGSNPAPLRGSEGGGGKMGRPGTQGFALGWNAAPLRGWFEAFFPLPGPMEGGSCSQGGALESYPAPLRGLVFGWGRPPVTQGCALGPGNTTHPNKPPPCRGAPFRPGATAVFGPCGKPAVGIHGRWGSRRSPQPTGCPLPTAPKGRRI